VLLCSIAACQGDHTSNQGVASGAKGTGPQGHRARFGLGPVLVLNFLYPSIRVRTAPPVSVRVRVRASIGLSIILISDRRSELLTSKNC